MNVLSKTLLTTSSGMLVATAAFAADPVVIPATPTPVVIVEPAGFDWNGFYASLYGAYHAPSGDRIWGVGGSVGYNFGVGSLVVGPEVLVYALFYDPTSINVVPRVRIGAAVGDRALIYGAIGYGFYRNPVQNDRFFHVAGGAEFAVGDSLSIRAEIGGYRYPSGTWSADIKAGVVFYFGG